MLRHKLSLPHVVSSNGLKAMATVEYDTMSRMSGFPSLGQFRLCFGFNRFLLKYVFKDLFGSCSAF